MPKTYPLSPLVGQCALCYQEMDEKGSVGTCHTVRICYNCEKQFKRTRIPKPPKRPVK